MKLIGYMIFACFFYIFRIFGCRNQKKVFCIATHDAGSTGNIGIMVEALKQKDSGYSFIYITRETKISNFIDFFIKKPYHLATSEYVLMDNAFLPMSFLYFSKKVKVVQLWHGTGAIKKFGQSVNSGLLKWLEYHVNRSITHLIVGSRYIKLMYHKAFDISIDKIYITGLPRTDVFFSEEKIEEYKNNFYNNYSKLTEKKIYMYAPTFRDKEIDNPKIRLDLDEMYQYLGEEEVLLLRLHPHVAKQFDEGMIVKYGDKIINVSDYSELNELLFITDVLITDYSSIIFEYSILGRPMIFYCYDLAEFSQDGRGFYEDDYIGFVPGTVAVTTKEVIESLKDAPAKNQKALQFVEKGFDFTDGNSVQRLYRLIFGNSVEDI